MNNRITQAQQAIQQGEALLITAGAGMGVDSGLPDFRGNHGFWKAYPPIAKRGISFIEMANPHWFSFDPLLAWAFYGHRLNLYRKTVPHKGFFQLLNCAKKMKYGHFIYTSNVDGQFQKAGFDESRIVECHGSIHHFQCAQPCSDLIWDASDSDIDIDRENFLAYEPLPSCKNCNMLARPNVLMFGDWNWISGRTMQQETRYQNWLKEIADKNARLIIIEIGAGQAVATVRMQSEHISFNMNATLIRINPRDYNVPAGHISIATGAAEGIRAIIT